MYYLYSIIILFVILLYFYITKKYNNKKEKKQKQKQTLLINKPSNLQLAKFYHEQALPYLAIKYYSKCINNGDYYVSLYIGNIYNYGLGELKPNYIKAKQFYTAFLTLKNNKQSNIDYVNEKLQELNNILKDKNDKKDKKEDELNVNKFLNDTLFDDEFLARVEEEKNNNTNIRRHTPLTINNHVPEIIQPIQFIPLQFNNGNLATIYEEDLRNETNDDYDELRNDPQNTHDSGVNLMIKNSVSKLKETTPIVYNYIQLKQKILNAIRDKDKLNNINKSF